MREVQAYAHAKLRKEPPVQCDLKVGDRVTYTNEYGVSFPRMLVIGFAHDDSFYGRFVHLAGRITQARTGSRIGATNWRRRTEMTDRYEKIRNALAMGMSEP